MRQNIYLLYILSSLLYLSYHLQKKCLKFWNNFTSKAKMHCFVERRISNIRMVLPHRRPNSIKQNTIRSLSSYFILIRILRGVTERTCSPNGRRQMRRVVSGMVNTLHSPRYYWLLSRFWIVFRKRNVSIKRPMIATDPIFLTLLK